MHDIDIPDAGQHDQTGESDAGEIITRERRGVARAKGEVISRYCGPPFYLAPGAMIKRPPGAAVEQGSKRYFAFVTVTIAARMVAAVQV